MTSKTCRECGETKPATEFHLSRANKDGRKNNCKPCYHRYTSEWVRANPNKRRVYARRVQLKSKFGMSEKDYYDLLEKQAKSCAICGGADPRSASPHFSVDHCHDTGATRGLLCTPCNTGIGQLKDSPTVLASALRYLAKHGKALPTEELHALLYGNTHDNPHRRL